MRRAYFVLLANVVAACAQPATPIDNEQARVLVVTDNPHHKGGMHEHAMNRVMIYLDPGEDRLAYEDGRVKDLNFKAGEVLWSAAGGRHTSENVGSKAFRVVEVELKTPGKAFTAPALDPVKVAPKNYKVVMDNAQVRVLRVRVEPHQKLPLHEHGLGRVVVYLRPYRIKVTPEGMDARESSGPAYDVKWAGPQKHTEENLSDEPFEVIAVDLK